MIVCLCCYNSNQNIKLNKMSNIQSVTATMTSRVHSRREGIRESLLATDIETQEGSVAQDEEMAEGIIEGFANLVAVNWSDFWKRAKIYPEHCVAYPDASVHVSSRQRPRNEVQANIRARSNAYVSDTDDESDTEDVIEPPCDIITCQGCRDKQANQMAHMDYGGCLCNDVVV